MKTCLVVLALLALTASAQGATELEAARAAASGSRAQVSQIRQQQSSLRGELAELSSRIGAAKADRGGKRLPSGALESELQRSQDLSGALAELARSLAAAELVAAERNGALLTTLSAELGHVRAQFERSTDRAARAHTIARMRALRVEREQVRAQLPSALVPSPSFAPGGDNPEDLLEQADVLKDNEDKVRRELAVLERRIAERREEREFDARVNEFLGEEALFDEQDRRLRARTERLETTRAAGAEDQHAGSQFSPAAASAPPTDFSGFESSPPPAARGPNEVQTVTRAGSDARPVVGVSHRVQLGADELDALQSERARLGALADELRKRARDIEAKAQSLR